MTPEQREAAIERAAAVIHDEAWESGDRPHKWADDESRTSRIIARRQADAALDALTDAGFLLLHRDDVTEEQQTVAWDEGDLTRDVLQGPHDLRYDPAYDHLQVNRRLVTRWEPITKEDNDA